MENLGLVIFFSLIGGTIALAGGILLIVNKTLAKKFVRYATPFAAGALLAATFVDFLPKALKHSDDSQLIMIFTLAGILFFFLMESVIHWLHNHSKKSKKTDPLIPMVIIGDVIHNFIDGIAIAAGFLISPASGIAVTFAVAAHEFPHEIGDFGLMLDRGVKRKKVILFNVLASLAAVFAATTFYIIGGTTGISLSPLLGIVAGFFIYIAAANIIPAIHQEKIKKEVVKKIIWLLLGVAIVSTFVTVFHSIIDDHGGCGGYKHDHDYSHSHDHHAHDDHGHGHDHSYNDHSHGHDHNHSHTQHDHHSHDHRHSHDHHEHSH